MIVLDTHALIWWAANDSRLSAKAAQAVAGERQGDGHVLVSAISLWEIAMLIEKDRLVLAMALDEWLVAVEAIDGLNVVSLGARTAMESVRLPGEFHSDTADRMIVALAREMNAPLVTADRKIRNYPYVKCIW